MENGDRIKVHERLAKLETQMESMLTNHLPHLASDITDLGKDVRDKIKSLDAKFWGVILLLIANLIAFIVK